MSPLVVGAYVTGAAVGVAATVAAVAAVAWLVVRVDEATTLPAPRRPEVLVDLAGRRSTGSWAA